MRVQLQLQFSFFYSLACGISRQCLKSHVGGFCENPQKRYQRQQVTTRGPWTAGGPKDQDQGTKRPKGPHAPIGRNPNKKRAQKISHRGPYAKGHMSIYMAQGQGPKRRHGDPCPHRPIHRNLTRSWAACPQRHPHQAIPSTQAGADSGSFS